MFPFRGVSSWAEVISLYPTELSHWLGATLKHCDLTPESEVDPEGANNPQNSRASPFLKRALSAVHHGSHKEVDFIAIPIFQKEKQSSEEVM